MKIKEADGVRVPDGIAVPVDGLRFDDRTDVKASLDPSIVVPTDATHEFVFVYIAEDIKNDFRKLVFKGRILKDKQVIVDYQSNIYKQGEESSSSRRPLLLAEVLRYAMTVIQGNGLSLEVNTQEYELAQVKYNQA